MAVLPIKVQAPVDVTDSVASDKSWGLGCAVGDAGEDCYVTFETLQKPFSRVSESQESGTKYDAVKSKTNKYSVGPIKKNTGSLNLKHSCRVSAGVLRSQHALQNINHIFILVFILLQDRSRDASMCKVAKRLLIKCCSSLFITHLFSLRCVSRKFH